MKKTFILVGALWGILSSPIMLSDVIREAVYQKLGQGIVLLFLLSPVAWTAFFTDERVVAIILSPILGGLAGFLLYTLIKARHRGKI